MTDLSQSLSFKRGPDWKNRLALAPLTNCQSHPDGTLSDEEFRWLTMRADGGFGLVMTCAAHVETRGQGFPGQLGAFSDDHSEGLTRLGDALRAKGAVSSLQLHHAGIRADANLVTDRVGASDDADTGSRALSEDEVIAVREAYIEAGVRADRAGLDGVELHGAHGYLVAQFLSPELNRREDAYGGSLENRARLMLEILEGLRARTRPDFQIGVRISPERFGMQLAEMKELAAELMARDDIDYLDLSLWDTFKMPADKDMQDKSLLGHFADLPRNGVRLGGAGKIRNAAEARRALDEGCDFAFVGRAAIVAHDFARGAIASADYAPPPLPVAAEYLIEEQGVSPVFAEYLKIFNGFLAA